MLEKEITTPDQYPLSLNGLTNGANQKSNRDPVMDLSESEVQDVLDELSALHLISEQTGFGSRVIKYKHRFCNTEFGNLQFSEQQRAIIDVLLLRGPQSAGELRTRTNRLASFANVAEVETALEGLNSHSEGQLVVKLAREPGKRDCRYVHQFSDTSEMIEAVAESAISPSTSSSPSTSGASSTDQNERIELLELQVEELSEQVATLTELMQQLTD